MFPDVRFHSLDNQDSGDSSCLTKLKLYLRKLANLALVLVIAAAIGAVIFFSVGQKSGNNIHTTHTNDSIGTSHNGSNFTLNGTIDGDSDGNSDLVDKSIVNNSDVALFLLTNLDTSIDPCDDFYAFACGGWQKRHPRTDSQGVVSQSSVTSDSVYKTVLKSLMQIERNSSMDTGVQKLLKFYDTCIDVVANYNGSDDNVAEVIRNVSGQAVWPLVGKSLKSSMQKKNPTIEEVIINIEKMNGKQMLFKTSESYTDLQPIKLEPVQHPLRSELRPFKLSMWQHPDALGSVVRAYKRAMLTVATDLLENIAPGTKQAAIENAIDEVFQFERDMADLLISARNEPDRNESDSYVVLTFEQLQSQYPTIRWDILLSGSSSCPMNCSIQVWYPQIVLSTVKLIASYRANVVVNYLLWEVIQANLPYIRKYRHLHKNFLKSLRGEKYDPDPEILCLKAAVVDPCYRTVMQNIYFSATKVDTALDQEVRAMVQIIRSMYIKSIMEHTWIPPDDRAVLVNVMRIISFGFIENPEADACSYVWESDEKDIVDKTDMILLHWGAQDKPITDTDNDHLFASIQARYSVWLNRIELGPGWLQHPFASVRYPTALKYAMVGVILGHEIAHAFGSDGINKITSNLTTNFIDEYNKRLNCFAQQSTYCYGNSSICVNGNATQDENIADAGAINQVFQAYKNEPLPIPGYDFGDFKSDQMFFISYASLHCTSIAPTVEKLRMLGNPHGSHTYRVNEALQNSKHFSNAFNCSVNSRMNPPDKCHLW